MILIRLISPSVWILDILTFSVVSEEFSHLPKYQVTYSPTGQFPITLHSRSQIDSKQMNMIFQFHFEEQSAKKKKKKNGTLLEIVLFDPCYLCLQKLADNDN